VASERLVAPDLRQGDGSGSVQGAGHLRRARQHRCLGGGLKTETDDRAPADPDIRANPAVALLVDEYDDADRSCLWWVRVDGIAQVIEDALRAALLESLRDQYPHYQQAPPQGPVVRADTTRVRRWAGETPSMTADTTARV
jgi:hypothetical protein